MRVASCEFLHASILWMVGTNARRCTCLPHPFPAMRQIHCSASCLKQVQAFEIDHEDCCIDFIASAVALLCRTLQYVAQQGSACVSVRRPLSREEQDFAAQPTQFHGIFKQVLPVALRLACGPEPVAWQLFEPLVMSLVHWFTRAARR